MNSGLKLVTLRQWSRHKLRLALTTLGIALGVAVFFAVRTTNTTLVNSLYATIETLAGKATLQITAGDTGFSSEYLKLVRDTPGVELAEGVTETIANTTAPTREKLLIIGVDTGSDLKLYTDMFDEGNFVVKNPLAFSSRSDSVAVSRTFANRFSLKDGDKLTIEVQGGVKELTVRGFFKSEGASEVFDGNVAMMDIMAAQEAFGRGARIDRIDVMTKPGEAATAVSESLSAQLPEGIKVERPNLRGQSLENAVSSMHFGLTLMSFLALTIGVFIIFNSFSISVSQRWKEIGVLRAIGVSRRGIQGMFLVEAILMGVFGSVIGIAGGYVLALISMRVVGNVTASFYGFAASPQVLEFDPVYMGQAVAAGIVASLAAAWLPARRASNVDPVLALHNIETQTHGSVISLGRLLAGIVLIVVGLLLTAYAPVSIGQTTQLFYSFLLLTGMVLLVPLFISVGSRIIRPVMSKIFGMEGVLAVEAMAHAPRRTSSTVIALLIGLSFVFAHGSFIQSQKAAIDRMLTKSVDSDILVSASTEVNSRTYHFSEEAAGRMASLPDVEVADPLRITSVQYDGQDISVLSHDMNAYFAISPDLLDKGDPEIARTETAKGNGILVSNNFAARWNKTIGDTVTIQSPNGPFTLTIVGLLDYFRSDKGTVFFDRTVYKKYWGDSDIDYMLLDLKPNADRAQVKESIQRVLDQDQKAFIYTHEEYRTWAGTIVDQFFSLMYVQMAVAFFVAVLGLVNTMVISVAERRREIGIFRAIGGLRRQVVKMVLLEAVAISLIGLAVGTIAGLLNAYYLVNTAARIIAGFSLPLVFPLWMILGAIPIVILMAILSAWFPARSASRLDVVDAVGYE